MTDNFDDIRPFYDSEIPAAMRRITESEHFPLLASWVYPGRDLEQVREMMLSFRNIDEFQVNVMKAVNEQVIDRTITALTSSGFENISTDTKYLFVSNHRDIMLDACLFNYLLWKHGHTTSEITFGANLMTPGLVTDIGKSNKMFRVERGGKMRELYLASVRLSNYLYHTISEKNESVWIAQRNGRTKDGIDQTDVGIINMFAMSGAADKVDALARLHIAPISVSYEWESCDILKALELYARRSGPYVKKPGEDLNSILTGLLQAKGRVHMAVCPVLTDDDLKPLADAPRAEFHKRVAAILDRRILSAYRLFPNNYIAHDLRNGTKAHADRYTAAEHRAFEDHMSLLNTYPVDEPEALRRIFLDIYANPVDRTAAVD